MIISVICAVLILVLAATALACLHAEIFYTESFAFDFSQGPYPIVVIAGSAFFAIYLSYPYFG